MRLSYFIREEEAGALQLSCGCAQGSTLRLGGYRQDTVAVRSISISAYMLLITDDRLISGEETRDLLSPIRINSLPRHSGATSLHTDITHKEL